MSDPHPIAGFDPHGATTLWAPPVGEPGHWIGAPALHRYRGDLLLALRRRTPDRRGYVLELRRAGDDPLDPAGYELLASVDPGGLGGVSLERAACYELPADPSASSEGRLSVLVGVDRGENDWVVRRLSPVDDPADIGPLDAATVLEPRPGTSDAVTVKDPVVVPADGRYWCFYAGHDGTSEQAHVATSDHGLAFDGRTFEGHTGPILGRAGWHDHHVRVAWARYDPDAAPQRRWVLAYEGSGTDDHGATWNLRTGFAAGPTPTELVDLTPDEPALVGGVDPESAGGTDATTAFRTCRYVDAVPHGDGWFVVAEVARPDGAFELRAQRVFGASDAPASDG